MTDKVINLTTIKPTESESVDAELMATLQEFKELLVACKARGFAAACVDADGVVITSWYSSMPHSSMVGALEMLKMDYTLSVTSFEDY